MKEKKKNKEETQVLEDFTLEEQQEHCECENCKESCECGDECQCENGKGCEHEEHECCHGNHECHCHEQNIGEQAGQYLAVAQRLQADFENYRKHVAEQLDRERQEGVKSVIEVFLPCLDTFKEAKKSIADESVMAGVNMIESKIMEALASLKVEKVETVGKVYDPHLHRTKKTI